jgi:hypothetical protein
MGWHCLPTLATSPRRVTRRCEGDNAVLDGAGSPRLVRVREPDHLGVERAHSPLAFGVRLVEQPSTSHRMSAARCCGDSSWNLERDVFPSG